MHCLKCGVEIADKQVFCSQCLEDMRQYPVKPESHVILPKRQEPAPVKKASPRKKTFTTEEKLEKFRKATQVLSIALISCVLALILSVSLLADLIFEHAEETNIGQNYSTMDDRNT